MPYVSWSFLEKAIELCPSELQRLRLAETFARYGDRRLAALLFALRVYLKARRGFSGQLAPEVEKRSPDLFDWQSEENQ
jgi:hypothetical protein